MARKREAAAVVIPTSAADIVVDVVAADFVVAAVDAEMQTGRNEIDALVAAIVQEQIRVETVAALDVAADDVAAIVREEMRRPNLAMRWMKSRSEASTEDKQTKSNLEENKDFRQGSQAKAPRPRSPGQGPQAMAPRPWPSGQGYNASLRREGNTSCHKPTDGRTKQRVAFKELVEIKKT